jgi:hypothetical protein
MWMSMASPILGGAISVLPSVRRYSSRAEPGVSVQSGVAVADDANTEALQFRGRVSNRDLV